MLSNRHLVVWMLALDLLQVPCRRPSRRGEFGLPPSVVVSDRLQ